MEKVGDSLRLRVPVIEDGTAEVYLVIPHVPVAEEILPQVPAPPQRGDQADRMTLPGTAAYFREVHRRTKQFWRRLLRKGAVIGIPEEKPSLTYYASIIGNFIARDGIVIKPGEGGSPMVTG